MTGPDLTADAVRAATAVDGARDVDVPTRTPRRRETPVKRPQKRYATIVADPPWDVMGGPLWGGGQSKPLPYPTMSVDEIAELPVHDLAERNAHLYLWTINAYLEDTYEIARRWGFKPSTLLTWAKPVTGGAWVAPIASTPSTCCSAAAGCLPPPTRSGSHVSIGLGSGVIRRSRMRSSTWLSR